jgi:hypothetical protein
VKNDVADWVCLGWVGRLGDQGSIVSNRSNGGKIYIAEELLKNHFNLNSQGILTLKNKMFYIAYQTCRHLDALGENFGYVAIDMAVDVNKSIWILEINHRQPSDRQPLYIDDIELYRKIKISKMMYLKYLSTKLVE